MTADLTITVNEELLTRAREVALSRGTSLEEMLLKYLRTLVEGATRAEDAAELLDLLGRHGGHSGGRRIAREDAHDPHRR